MQKEIDVIYDTSALIELVGETKNRKRVEELFMDDDTNNCIPSVVLAEFISKLHRGGVNPSRFVEILEENAVILPLNGEIAKSAGRLHFELKKKETAISLVDCIIMAHGKERGEAKIVSKDKHFKHYKNVEILE